MLNFKEMKKTLVLLSSAMVLMLNVKAQNLQETIKLTQSERFEDASAAFKNLVKSDTKGDVYFYYGDNFLKWEELDSAKTVFNEGLKVNSANPLIHAGLGKVALLNGKNTEATAEFNKAIELLKADKSLGKDAQATVYNKIAEGYIYTENKNPDEALKYVTEAEKLNMKDPEVYILRGDALLAKSTGDASESIKNFEKASELDRNNRRAILRQANLYRQVNNFDEALVYYNQAISMDPSFAPAYRERAELYYRAGKIQNGIEDYKKYLELNNSPSARGRYASFLYVAKDYNAAIKEINDVMAQGNTAPILYRVLGYSYYETKNFSEGLKNIEKFMSIATTAGKPKIIMLDYSYYGKLLAENGKDSLGIAEIKKALDIDPSFIDGYNDIASIYFKAKNFSESAKYYRLKISKTEKNDYNDYNYLGRALYQSKDFAGADSAFTKVSELLPNLTIGYVWAARSKNKMDNQEAPTGLAKSFYEKVITIGSSEPEKNKKDLIEAYSYLGFFYFVNKDYNCSKTAWLKVKELDAANEKATAALSDKNISTGTTCELIKVSQP